MNKIVLVSIFLVGLVAIAYGEHEREERFILSSWVRGLGNGIMDKVGDAASSLGIDNDMVKAAIEKGRAIGNKVIDVTEVAGAKVGVGAKAAGNLAEAAGGEVVKPPSNEPEAIDK